ncbi:MAG: hypothetical protein P8X74_22970 [Reinekea sp.]
MLHKNWGEPMGAPTIFEQQIEIRLLHPASTLKSRIQENQYLNESLSFRPETLLRQWMVHTLQSGKGFLLMIMQSSGLPTT